MSSENFKLQHVGGEELGIEQEYEGIETILHFTWACNQPNPFHSFPSFPPPHIYNLWFKISSIPKTTSYSLRDRRNPALYSCMELPSPRLFIISQQQEAKREHDSGECWMRWATEWTKIKKSKKTIANKKAVHKESQTVSFVSFTSALWKQSTFYFILSFLHKWKGCPQRVKQFPLSLSLADSANNQRPTAFRWENFKTERDVKLISVRSPLLLWRWTRRYYFLFIFCFASSLFHYRKARWKIMQANQVVNP